MNSDFSRIITLQRKERKISQKQAAADLGISQALLSHYEKGIRECGLDFLVKIADYYNVSCDYLLGRSPEPEGKTITIDEIPDDDGNNAMPSPEVITFNRRIINNSISLLFALAQKANSITLIKEVSSYLMLSVYKLFRIVYNANPRNDQKLFKIPKVIANDSANAIISMNEADIKAASSGIAIGPHDCVTDTETLYITTATLSQDYAEYSASLLNLIKISEDSISRTRHDG
ncbi:MAG: helix-turn-helix transcriptional regulator [Ruminococcus sp.]|nr:helix-turn-helix transcriptional regulator [Ruminococcus sp.]MBQ8906379.1 helix-turn-helix transcriptional regulator [Ruminococcus sp.]